MSYEKTISEKNIEKLISTSIKAAPRPDELQKEALLQIVLQKSVQQRKDFRPGIAIVAGLSGVWIIISVLLFTGFMNPVFTAGLVKAVSGLSLFLIPASSIILIILKSKSYEKRLV